MMPIINIRPHASEAEAEAFRLTLKDADKFGLYCCHDGKSAMWSVIPKIALNLIFNAETGLPVIERTWVGLTKEERHEISMANRPYCADVMAAHEEELKRRNT